jgi:hypothetical protein
VIFEMASPEQSGSGPLHRVSRYQIDGAAVCDRSRAALVRERAVTQSRASAATFRQNISVMQKVLSDENAVVVAIFGCGLGRF